MIDYLNISCPCYLQESYKNSKLIIQCTSCKKYQHKLCIRSMAKMARYQCPFCQLKKGALFFNVLYSLIEPSLVEFNPNNKILSEWITFIPDSNVYSTFLTKFKDSPTAIIIRCMRFDKNGFSFHWPKMSKIYINDKIILDLTKKGSKQRDRMIALIPGKDYEKDNISKKFFLYDSNIFKNEDYLIEKKPNRLGLQVYLNDGEKMEYKNYLISIDLCEIYKDPKPIIDDIPIINSKKEIKEILSNNEEENTILSIKEKISLLDIYTETDRIKIPARGINCCHLNVFDLKTFLIINRKTNKFQCPFCKRYSNDLYIDGIIYDFLKNTENEKISEIFVDKDLNIFLNEQKDKKIENISDINGNTNSYSNDETCKTDIHNRIHIEEDIKERRSKNNKIRKSKRKRSNLIQILEDDSENKEENRNNSHENEKYIHVNENDFNNSKCNIISDLGELVTKIREDILSEKKDKNNSDENRIMKHSNKSRKKYSIFNRHFYDSDSEGDITMEPGKIFNHTFKKKLGRKHKRNEYDSGDESYEFK